MLVILSLKWASPGAQGPQIASCFDRQRRDGVRVRVRSDIKQRCKKEGGVGVRTTCSSGGVRRALIG